jgi:hypothetical protein
MYMVYSYTFTNYVHLRVDLHLGTIGLHRTLVRASLSNVGVNCHSKFNTEAEFMERTFSLRFLGIVLRVLRLEVFVWIS